MLIGIFASVVICCLICGCLIFKKYKKHKEKQEYERDPNPFPNYNNANTGQVMPFMYIPNTTVRENTGYIHPFNYPHHSQQSYNYNNYPSDRVILENPEKIGTDSLLLLLFLLP